MSMRTVCYRVIETGRVKDKVKEDLDKQGEEGWELAGVIDGQPDPILIFKKIFILEG